VRARRASTIRFLLAVALLSACAGTTPPAPARDRCGLADRPWQAALPQVRAEARAWLRLAEVRVEKVYDAAPANTGRRLQFPPGARPRALVSYGDAGPGDPLRDRSFLYDDALALLWLTATGDQEAARDLAATLLALQSEDGTWGFSFSVADGFYNAAYVRAGAVAWVAHALAVYARRFRDVAADIAATRGARALLQARRPDGPAAPGLVEGGRGRWSPDERSFFPGFRLRAAITEHQLDAQMALAQLAPAAADDLAQRIVASLWLQGEGRFAVAADESGPDPGRALDAAGGWGALWLASRGDLARARRSLKYTVAAFATRGSDVPGFRPYLDPVDGPLSAMEPDLVFVEGTLGVGLAAHRLGERTVAEAALETAVRLACRYGPGVPYANRPAHGFPVRPAAAPTLWFLFLDHELNGGGTTAVFPAAGGGS